MTNLNRNLIITRSSITSILLSYATEVINALTTLIAIPVLFSYGVKALPYGIAQPLALILWTLGAMIPAIGIAIACFEVLYVTNFSTSFDWNPERVGKLSLILISLVCFSPFLLIFIESIGKGGHAVPASAIYSNHRQ
jgi:hypothetical protein